MKKRLLSVLLVLCMMLGFAPVASAVDINDSNVFLKQAVSGKSGTCTLASITMMLRRRAIVDNMSDWSSITEAATKSTFWSGGIKAGSHIYKGMKVSNFGLISNGYTDAAKKKAYFISMLQSHPEGVVAYQVGVHKGN